MQIKFLNKTIFTFLGFILVILMGYADFKLGYFLSFSLFYLIPIIFVTWYSGINSGILISMSSAIAWFLADHMARPGYPHFLIPYWNATIRLGFFLTVTILLAKLQITLGKEKQLARKDHLTNAWNRLAFYELAKIENARAERHNYPITLVYIDLDKFKTVNDQFGHSVGDELLVNVVNVIQGGIRASDILARFGGDEFTLLLPEVSSDTAFKLVHRIRKELLLNMQKRSWPVTFSIGMITFIKPASSINEMLKITDDLMYTVKRNLKNDILHKVYI